MITYHIISRNSGKHIFTVKSIENDGYCESRVTNMLIGRTAAERIIIKSDSMGDRVVVLGISGVIGTCHSFESIKNKLLAA